MNVFRTMTFLVATAGVIILPFSVCAQSTNTLAVQVRAVMDDIEEGKLRKQTPRKLSGWVMTNEKGRTFHRTMLQEQANIIINLGQDAVPELIKWVGHEEMQVRYVASFSLEKITGVKQCFSAFATLKELQSKEGLGASVRSWSNWYEARPTVKVLRAEIPPLAVFTSNRCQSVAGCTNTM